ncbi:MAG: lantibiotic leader peptide-processing serine protease, partial [Gaiellaceae bacterium]|nr:lantibiotic leader peptide-processing serine protease [Gaiellaceae bacterium]
MIRRFTTRLCVLAVVAIAGAAFASVAQAERYVILYKSQAVPADAAATIQKAGGTVVYSYGQIGVVIANSTSSSFRDNLLKDQKIENASGTSA